MQGPAILVHPPLARLGCEVVSPSTERLDRRQKLAIYRRERVSHVWLVNPLSRTLEVLELAGEHYAIRAVHAGDEKLRAVPFDAFELDLSILWADVELPPMAP